MVRIQQINMKGISVVIPVYNRKKELFSALSSILSQTRIPEEIIIVDDASENDLSWVIDSFPTLNIIVHRLPVKSNASVARNSGITWARFDLIAFLDSDDYWEPAHLEKLEKLLEMNLDGDIAFGRPKKRRQKKINIYKIDYAISSFVQNRIFFDEIDINTSGLMIKKKVFQSILFCENLEKHQDWDFLLQAEKAGFKFVDADEPTYEWKKEASNRISKELNWESSELFLKRNWESLQLPCRARLLGHLLRKYSKYTSEKQRQIHLMKMLGELSISEGRIAKQILPLVSFFSCPGKTYCRLIKVLKLWG